MLFPWIVLLLVFVAALIGFIVHLKRRVQAHHREP
jgi:hypothetical protein